MEGVTEVVWGVGVSLRASRIEELHGKFMGRMEFGAPLQKNGIVIT